jgi:hypothetical protein
VKRAYPHFPEEKIAHPLHDPGHPSDPEILIEKPAFEPAQTLRLEHLFDLRSHEASPCKNRGIEGFRNLGIWELAFDV